MRPADACEPPGSVSRTAPTNAAASSPSSHQITFKESGVNKERPIAASSVKVFSSPPRRPPTATLFVSVSDGGRYQPPNHHFLSADRARTKGHSSASGGRRRRAQKSKCQRSRTGLEQTSDEDEVHQKPTNFRGPITFF